MHTSSMWNELNDVQEKQIKRRQKKISIPFHSTTSMTEPIPIVSQHYVAHWRYIQMTYIVSVFLEHWLSAHVYFEISVAYRARTCVDLQYLKCSWFAFCTYLCCLCRVCVCIGFQVIQRLFVYVSCNSNSNSNKNIPINGRQRQ